MRCGRGHDHANIAEVKACYGLPADLRVREENLVPAGPRPGGGPRAALNAQRKAEQERNTALYRAGNTHSFTPACPECVAGTHAPSEAEMFSTPPATPPPAENGPTEKQMEYLNTLLSRRSLVIADRARHALTKRTISVLIDDVRAWTPDKPLWSGLSLEAGKISADAEERPARREPLPDVPEGHYAIASLTGNNDLDFFRVDRPTEGDWKGKTYIKRVIGGKPDQNIRFSQYREVLHTILDTGIKESGMMYADKIGRCYRCNRHLTDEESRARGLGPDCASK